MRKADNGQFSDLKRGAVITSVEGDMGRVTGNWTANGAGIYKACFLGAFVEERWAVDVVRRTRDEARGTLLGGDGRDSLRSAHSCCNHSQRSLVGLAQGSKLSRQADKLARQTRIYPAFPNERNHGNQSSMHCGAPAWPIRARRPPPSAQQPIGIPGSQRSSRLFCLC